MFKFLNHIALRRRRTLKNRERGQSLVEMAVIVPILLFIFLGLIEVGWAIRGYLVLLTSGRETTRFAARGEYLNFEGVELADPYTTVGYQSVLRHTAELLASNGLGVDIDLTGTSTDGPNGTFILSHFLIDTGYPCLQEDENDQCLQECASGDYYGYDDLILFPGKAGYEHFTYTAGLTETSRIDQLALVDELVQANNEFNCQALERSAAAEMSVNSLIMVESFFDQGQLVGVPLISNALTDPIGLYNQTKMRISPGNGLSQGEGCELIPIALHQDAAANTELSNIFQGSGPGQFGWLRWKSGKSNYAGTNANTNSSPYLTAEIENPRLAIHDYVNPNNSDDTVLNVGDSVWGLPGATVSSDVRAEMDLRVGQTVTLPVYSNANSGGANAQYNIVGFNYVRITEINWNGANTSFSGENQGPNPNCPTADITSPITVDSPAPTLVDDTASVGEGTSITIDVLNNDQNVTETSLTIISGPTPNLGTATVSSGNIEYTAPASHSPLPTDVTITYEACNADATPECAQATLTITIVEDSTPPVPVNDTLVAHVNRTPVTVDVLANDTYAGGNPPMTLNSVGAPAVGSATISSGQIDYLPPTAYNGNGLESFTYEVCDSTLANCATGTVEVELNHPPQTQDDNHTMNLGDTPTPIDVLTNDNYGPDHPSRNDSLVPSTVSVTRLPADGTATVNPTSGQITFTPDSGFTGVNTFTYQVCDTKGACTEATVTVNVVFSGTLAEHDFNDGSLSGGQGWIGPWSITPNNGSIRIAGNRLRMRTKYQLGTATRSVNLGTANYSSVRLTFRWRARDRFGRFSLAGGTNDTFRVMVQHGSGPTTTELLSYGGQANGWTNESFELLNTPYTIDQNGPITLIFQTDMRGWWNRTIQIDDIQITVAQ